MCYFCILALAAEQVAFWRCLQGIVKFGETAAPTGLYKLSYMVLFSLFKEDRFP